MMEIDAERYAICSLTYLVGPTKNLHKYQSPIADGAQQSREVEPGSIVLFFMLLSAFIAVLILRAHLLVPVDSNAAVAASAAPPVALAAKPSPRQPNF
jgi:hypothetical protein